MGIYVKNIFLTRWSKYIWNHSWYGETIIEWT